MARTEATEEKRGSAVTEAMKESIPFARSVACGEGLASACKKGRRGW